MTMRINIGIDPGLSGGVVFLFDGEAYPRISVWDLPVREAVTKGKKKRNEVDAFTLANLIRDVWRDNPGADMTAAIEQVSAAPVEGRQQGTTSMFHFGEGFGRIVGVLETIRVPYSKVPPQAWKKEFGLIGKAKDDARTLAIERFPTVAETLKRKKDHGRADALWLALWKYNRDMQCPT